MHCLLIFNLGWNVKRSSFCWCEGKNHRIASNGGSCKELSDNCWTNVANIQVWVGLVLVINCLQIEDKIELACKHDLCKRTPGRYFTKYFIHCMYWYVLRGFFFFIYCFCLIFVFYLMVPRALFFLLWVLSYEWSRRIKCQDMPVFVRANESFCRCAFQATLIPSKQKCTKQYINNCKIYNLFNHERQCIRMMLNC